MKKKKATVSSKQISTQCLSFEQSKLEQIERKTKQQQNTKTS